MPTCVWIIFHPLIPHWSVCSNILYSLSPISVIYVTPDIFSLLISIQWKSDFYIFYRLLLWKFFNIIFCLFSLFCLYIVLWDYCWLNYLQCKFSYLQKFHSGPSMMVLTRHNLKKKMSENNNFTYLPVGKFRRNLSQKCWHSLSFKKGYLFFFPQYFVFVFVFWPHMLKLKANTLPLCYCSGPFCSIFFEGLDQTPCFSEFKPGIMVMNSVLLGGQLGCTRWNPSWTYAKQTSYPCTKAPATQII